MLTQRGGGVVSSLIFFFLVSSLAMDPMFFVPSSILLLIFSLEALKFRWATRALERWAVERHMNYDKTFVGERLRVALSVRYEGSRVAAILQIKDLIPDGFRLVEGSNVLVERLSGSKEFSLNYTIEALSIGKIGYRGVEVCVYDGLGIFVKRKVFSCPSLITVYPRIHSTYVKVPGRPRLAIKLEERGLQRKGLGTELSGIREYVRGDDHRLIAWKAMAKSPKLEPMTKELEELKALDIIVAFLSRPSMKEGLAGKRKIDIAAQATITLAGLALREGHSVALVYPKGSGIEFVKEGILRMADHITRMSLEEVDIRRLVDAIRANVKKRSLIIFITDLPYPSTIDLDPVRSLRSEGHLVRFIILHTPYFFPEPKDEDERTIVELLNTVEDLHTKEFFKACSQLGIVARLCGPQDGLTKLIDTFSEVRRVSIP